MADKPKPHIHEHSLKIIREAIREAIRGKVVEGQPKDLNGFEKSNPVTINIFVVQGGDMPKQPTPQERYHHTYIILSFVFGALLVLMILGLTVVFPNPTPTQMRIWIPVMSLAAGGFATTMTGVLRVDIKLGKKLIIGATAALGVLVLLYLVNPGIIGS